jgi:hypothetical protein
VGGYNYKKKYGLFPKETSTVKGKEVKIKKTKEEVKHLKQIYRRNDIMSEIKFNS